MTESASLNAVVRSSQIENLLALHIDSSSFARHINVCRRSFQHEQYANVTNIFPREITLFLKDEVTRVLQSCGVRRDLTIAATQNTPRSMTNLRYADLRAESSGINSVYTSSTVKNMVSHIVGEEVFDCPWENERYIATRLHKAGDTHGWHWDDYAYSLLWVLQSPPSQLGGNLQIVPNTGWDKENPDISGILEKNKGRILTKKHESGEIYLFRSDCLLHRVSPLTEDGERTALNMVYANLNDVRANKTHETMNELFE